MTGSISPVDVLVFVPHPDDEAIGVGGTVQQARAAGRTVRIVFATSGDAYPQAASALLQKPIAALGPSDYIGLATTRQREAVAAGELLGLSGSSLVFLGYPDAALTAVYLNASVSPTESPTTGQRSTYGPAQTDYHTLVHGQPAPYTRSSVVADVVDILRESRPGHVYVTDRADGHDDHSALYNIVRDAAGLTDYRESLLTFVVHSGPNESWPWPQGAMPHSRFETHTIDGTTYPTGVHWPPPVRVPLTAEQSAVKLRAIAAHKSQCAVDGQYLESFVKSEEVFWIGS